MLAFCRPPPRKEAESGIHSTPSTLSLLPFAGVAMATGVHPRCQKHCKNNNKDITLGSEGKGTRPGWGPKQRISLPPSAIPRKRQPWEFGEARPRQRGGVLTFKRLHFLPWDCSLSPHAHGHPAASRVSTQCLLPGAMGLAR